VPIYKGGDRNKCANYRPISVLPAVSKILEMAMKDRLLTFLDSQEFLYPNNMGLEGTQMHK